MVLQAKNLEAIQVQVPPFDPTIFAFTCYVNIVNKGSLVAKLYKPSILAN